MSDTQQFLNFVAGRLKKLADHCIDQNDREVVHAAIRRNIVNHVFCTVPKEYTLEDVELAIVTILKDGIVRTTINPKAKGRLQVALKKLISLEQACHKKS